MTVPKFYRDRGEAAIATYDFTDIAEGTGVVKYFLATTETDSGTGYVLTTSELYSTDIDTVGTNTGAIALTIDLDFDLTEFNLPKIIKGTAVFQGMMRIAGPGGGGGSMYTIIQIRKWDGTTETDIASAQSQTVAVGASANAREFVTLPITIPLTHFKKGETLRVTWEGWIGGSGTTPRGDIAHDPQNRDAEFIKPSSDTSPTSITKSHIYIPYRLDL